MQYPSLLGITLHDAEYFSVATIIPNLLSMTRSEAGAGDESETMFVFVSNLGILIFTDLTMSERVYCRFVFKKTVFSCELG